jgi:hypothetical protein
MQPLPHVCGLCALAKAKKGSGPEPSPHLLQQDHRPAQGHIALASIFGLPGGAEALPGDRYGSAIYRQIMDVYMAIKASCKLTEHPRIVRFAVTGCALRNQPVAGMAFCAMKTAVLASGGL